MTHNKQEKAQIVLDAVHEMKSYEGASRLLTEKGIHLGVHDVPLLADGIKYQYDKALEMGLVPMNDSNHAYRKPFDIAPREIDPDEPIDNLIQRRVEVSRRKIKSYFDNRVVDVNVKINGPYGLALFGDPHVDDDGTNLEKLLHQADIVNETEGLFAGNVGDITNNWVGRLQALYADQSTTSKEAWRIAEYFMRKVDWMFLVKGNHDCLDDQTELFTRRGWISYNNIQQDDQVMGIDPDGGARVWQDINEIIIHPVDEELYYFEGPLVSLACTAGHRVFHMGKGGFDFSFAKDLSDEVLNIPTTFSGTFCYVETTMTPEKKHYTGDVWCLRVQYENFMVRRNGKIHFTGNCWSGNGDPLDYIMRGSNALTAPHGMTLRLNAPKGNPALLSIRHDFKGRSQWNDAFGPAKAAQMGGQCHLYACGHTHTSAYTNGFNEQTGIFWHAMRIGSEKIVDDHVEKLGFPFSSIFTCPVVLIDPTERDPLKFMRIEFDTQEGADRLKWMRSRHGV